MNLGIILRPLLPLVFSEDPSGSSQGAHRRGEGEGVRGRHLAGVITSTPYDGGPVEQRDLLSCIHCAYTWVPRPGSGRLRGYCMRCAGFLCGRPACTALGCVHREQLLENIEAARALNFVPISVAFND